MFSLGVPQFLRLLTLSAAISGASEVYDWIERSKVDSLSFSFATKQVKFQYLSPSAIYDEAEIIFEKQSNLTSINFQVSAPYFEPRFALSGLLLSFIKHEQFTAQSLPSEADIYGEESS